MFTIFLTELAGHFDRHWLRSAFFPSLAVWFAGLLAYALARGLTATLDTWRTLSVEMQILLPLAGLSWVTFFAYLLGHFQTSLIRFYEGYWQRYPFKWLRPGRTRHYLRQSVDLQRQMEELQNRPESQALYLESKQKWHICFPPDDAKIMPTRLGNIIRAAELYSLDRYELDAVVIWPRLYGLLPDNLISALRASKADLDLLLSLTTLALGFGLIACGALAFYTTQRLLFLGCAFSFLLAWLCYRSSLNNAQRYAELIKTTFDLHRWKLLEALHIKRPTTYDEERRIWKDVTYLIYGSHAPCNVTYENATPEPTAEGGFNVVGWLKHFFQSDDDDQGAAPPALPPGPEALLPSIWTSRPLNLLGFWYFVMATSFCLTAFLLMGKPSAPIAGVPVLIHDLPAYHLIQLGDYEIRSLETASLPTDAMKEDPLLLDHYTLQALTKDQVICQSQIQSVQHPNYLADTTAVAIQATSAMTLGGSLHAGDVINITFIREKNSTASTAGQCIFENLVVLDIKNMTSAIETQPPSAVPSQYPFVLILALPQKCLQDFADNTAAMKFLISRHL